MQNKHATRITHGDTGTRLYNIWNTMIRRCELPSAGSYKWYGGKGVSVCHEWRTSYVNFKAWAKENGYKSNLTIDRIDSNNDYCPGNCRWISMKEQQNNRCNNHIITFNGESHTLSQWAEIIGMSPKTLSRRIVDKGWSIERALTTPLCKWKSHRREAC